MKFDECIFEDGIGRVSLVAHTQAVESPHTEALHCTDLMPCMAARVSYGNNGVAQDFEKDQKLMRYLAEHDHMSPFEHQSATFRIVAPIFVAREWMRHRTQAYNEMSMRYTSKGIGDLYSPDVWRKQSDKNKQGSDGFLSEDDSEYANIILRNSYEMALETYHALLKIGAARELARLAIPVGHYTEFYATANLRNWDGFCRLRCAPNAQYEIRQYAFAIEEALLQLWPASWGVLVGKRAAE